jgi:putative hydrolase of the HAD superfamily
LAPIIFLHSAFCFSFMPSEFIYFDLGNVICYFDRPRQFRQIAELTGANEKQVAELLAGDDGMLWKCERGEITDDEYHQQYSQATGTTSDFSAFLHAHSDIFTLNTSILPLLAHLEDSQIPLGLLSNTGSAHWRHVTDGRFTIVNSAFRVQVLSFQVGAMKPDEKVFRRAIEVAGVPAGRIVFIDDIPAYAEAARQAGIDAIQYNSTWELTHQLLARGVRCNF